MFIYKFPFLDCLQLCLGINLMIQSIDQLQVSINERLDHLQMLLLDSNQLSLIMKDDEKKRAVVRNFRVIKAAEKARINLQQRQLQNIFKINKRLTKRQINLWENMFVNCINQYLNSEYESKNTGSVNDLIDAFAYYFQAINAISRKNRLKVIKNCGLFYDSNFLFQNLSFFISNIQESLNHVYEKKKVQFFNCLKSQNRTISPEKRSAQDQDLDRMQRFDKTGANFGKKKRNLQFYCFEITKILQLQHVCIDYFYFSAMDFERRKKILQSNFMKRNIHIIRQIQYFEKDYQSFKGRKISSQQNNVKIKRKQTNLHEESTHTKVNNQI